MARGKYSKAISDRSGMEFPYTEMVKEWNGSFVHRTEYEEKHPQLELRTRGADAEGLLDSRVDRSENEVIAILGPNPFESNSALFIQVTSQKVIAFCILLNTYFQAKESLIFSSK